MGNLNEKDRGARRGRLEYNDRRSSHFIHAPDRSAIPEQPELWNTTTRQIG